MAEVISCASAVFSLGWILYESGEVMSHDIHDILQKCQNHIPLLHSPLWLWVGITRIAQIFSQGLEMGVKLSEGAVGETYVTCHNLPGLVHSKYWYGNQEQVIHCKLWTWARRGSVGQAGKSVESEIELNIWHSWLCSVCPLNSLLSVQVGFSLPSPDFPLVSGVDNPVGDTAQSSTIFAFNWRLTSTYSEPTFVFSWLLGLTHVRSGFHLAIHSPTLGSSSAHLMHFDCINFQVTNSIILNFPAFSVACQPN